MTCHLLSHVNSGWSDVFFWSITENNESKALSSLLSLKTSLVPEQLCLFLLIRIMTVLAWDNVLLACLEKIKLTDFKHGLHSAAIIYLVKLIQFRSLGATSDEVTVSDALACCFWFDRRFIRSFWWIYFFTSI